MDAIQDAVGPKIDPAKVMLFGIIAILHSGLEARFWAVRNAQSP